MSRLADAYPCAFLTGVSGGLGHSFATMLLDEGVRVWGSARDGARLAALAAKYPTSFIPVVLDLLEPEAAEATLVRSAKAAGGAFDLVVNNAGYGFFGPFETTDFAVWKAQLDGMVSTTLRLSHAAMQGMRTRNRGCLVNVSSLATEFPLPYMSGYNVAKAALSAFSESLFIETRGSGLTVIDFRPGDYRTDFNRSMQKSSSNQSHGDRLVRAWQALEANLNGAPHPERAAADLRRALVRGRSGVVRSGSLFQSRVAPFLAALAPGSWRRAVAAKYFGL